MNLDGTEESFIVPEGYEETFFYGVYHKDEKLYLVGTDNELVVTDMSGKILNKWAMEGPSGWQGKYADIEIIGDKIYIPSQNPMVIDAALHILVYEENEE